MMFNFKNSLEKRFHISVRVSLSPHLCVRWKTGLGGGGCNSGLCKKLKIHKAVSGDEVKCCQSV